MHEDIAKRAYDSTLRNGGTTVNLQGAEPTEGYAYSPFPELSKVIPANMFKPEHVHQYINDNALALTMPGNHLGTWHETSSGNVFLDVSHVGPAHPDTVAEAKKAKQRAVFDLSNFNEIPTGLKGQEVHQAKTAAITLNEITHEQAGTHNDYRPDDPEQGSNKGWPWAQQRKPFIYQPETGTIHMGDVGMHHGNIAQRLQGVHGHVHEGWMNTRSDEPEAASEGFVGWYGKPEDPHSEAVENHLRQRYPNVANSFAPKQQPDSWQGYFGKRLNAAWKYDQLDQFPIPEYQLGQERRAIVDQAGNAFLGPIHDTHGQIAHGMGVKPRSYHWVGDDGSVIMDNYNQNKRNKDDAHLVAALHPHLHVSGEEQDTWDKVWGKVNSTASSPSLTYTREASTRHNMTFEVLSGWQLPEGHGVLGPQSPEEFALNDPGQKRLPVSACPQCHVDTTFPLGGCPHCGWSPHIALLKPRQASRAGIPAGQARRVIITRDGQQVILPMDTDAQAYAQEHGLQVMHSFVVNELGEIEHKTADMVNGDEEDVTDVIGQAAYDEWQFSDDALTGSWDAEDVIEWSKTHMSGWTTKTELSDGTTRTTIDGLTPDEALAHPSKGERVRMNDGSIRIVETDLKLTPLDEVRAKRAPSSTQGSEPSDAAVISKSDDYWVEEPDEEEPEPDEVETWEDEGGAVVEEDRSDSDTNIGRALDLSSAGVTDTGDRSGVSVSEVYPLNPAKPPSPTIHSGVHARDYSEVMSPVEELRASLTVSRPSFKALLSCGSIREPHDSAVDLPDVFSTNRGPTLEQREGTQLSFGMGVPQVIEVDHGENYQEFGDHGASISGHADQPFVWHPEGGKLWLGQPGGWHGDVLDQSGLPWDMEAVHGRLDSRAQTHDLYDNHENPEHHDILSRTFGTIPEGGDWGDVFAHVGSHKDASIPKGSDPREPHKCKSCDKPATMSLIWAEGAAYAPVCDEHEASMRKHLGPHEVNEVIKIGSHIDGTPPEVIEVAGRKPPEEEGDFPLVYLPSSNKVYRGAQSQSHAQLVMDHPDLVAAHHQLLPENRRYEHPMNLGKEQVEHGRQTDDGRIYWFNEHGDKGGGLPHVEKALGGTPGQDTWEDRFDIVGKISAGNVPYNEGDPIEPWEPGHEGKGMFLGGEPLMWKLNDQWGGPHHGDVAFHHDPTEENFADGYFHIGPDGTTVAEGSDEHLEDFIAHDPRLRSGQEREWPQMFGKVAHKIIESETGEYHTLFDQPGDMVPHRTGDRPVVHHIPTDTTYIGNLGQHHADVISDHGLDVHPDVYSGGPYPPAEEDPYGWSSQMLDKKPLENLSYALITPGMVDPKQRKLQTWGQFPEHVRQDLTGKGYLSPEMVHDAPEGWERAFGKTAIEIPGSPPEVVDWRHLEDKSGWGTNNHGTWDFPWFHDKVQNKVHLGPMDWFHDDFRDHLIDYGIDPYMEDTPMKEKLGKWGSGRTKGYSIKDKHVHDALSAHGVPGPHSDWNEVFGKTAKETPGQEARRWESLNVEHPNSAQVVHNLKNGWTVQQLRTTPDVIRTGKMMVNCWRGKINALMPKRKDSDSGYYTLNDHAGVPRVAFNNHPYAHEQGGLYDPPRLVENATAMQGPMLRINNPLGRNNKRLTPDHANLFREWAQERGLPLAMEWNGQPLHFDHPAVQNAYFSGKGIMRGGGINVNTGEREPDWHQEAQDDGLGGDLDQIEDTDVQGNHYDAKVQDEEKEELRRVVAEQRQKMDEMMTMMASTMATQKEAAPRRLIIRRDEDGRMTEIEEA